MKRKNKESHADWLKSAATTHYPTPLHDQALLPEKEKIAYIAQRFGEIMEALGLDLKDESLIDTPQRVAKMYVTEIFAGLDLTHFPEISTVDDHYKYHEQAQSVFMKVNFCSFCEHHFVPMIGKAYVAYLPNRKLIGLSKIPRLVRYFSRRPQLQERLTAQIADSLSFILETNDVAVSLAAEHYCIHARGVEDEESHAITTVLRGKFEAEPTRRQEFFENVNRPL